MIKGIGTDIIEIMRIQKAIENEHFLEKYFTVREIELYKRRSLNPEVLAGNFSVKEAVAKSLGTGFRGFGPKDIEVLRDDLGRPVVVLHQEALKLSDELGIQQFHVSISHNRESAVGFVVAEGKS